MDIIQTDRLATREFTQVDIDKVLHLLSDPIAMKYVGETNILNKKIYIYLIKKMK